jgi:hypothetical protein
VGLDHIGRYEIQRRLGTGGMGSLYLARDPALDRLVAIKLLKDDYQDDAELRERFVREARSVARLRHRNIVLVFDVGEHEGRQFMAMEYLPGQTLTKLLGRTPPVSLVQRLTLAEQLCAGLAHAHAAGIVHRDIKPANIMLDAEGVLKILDFGIARLIDSGITRDGMMMGSVNYMSPEQVVGKRVDHRTDIFAAGAVLYELVGLTQAFPGGIDSGVLNRILNEGHRPLSEVAPGVDPALAHIVDRALERDPDKRYQDVDLMRRDLTHVRRRLPAALDEGERSPLDETIVLRPRTPAPSERGRREDTDRRKKSDSERFVAIRHQQAEEHLRLCRQALEQGDHRTALEAAERAAAIDPDNQEAFDLMDRTRTALEALAVRQALDDAERLLAEGRLTEAEPLIDRGLEASTLDTPDARDLHARARQLLDQAAAVRDHRRRIASSLERARLSIDDRRFETALRAIGDLLTLDPENVEGHELQAKATRGISALREHEQKRREAHAQIDLARELATDHRYQEAVDTLEAIVPPTDTVRLAVRDVAAFVEQQQRAAARDAVLATIRGHIEANAFEHALAAIDAVSSDERTGELRALRIKAENGLRTRAELERKRIELNRVMTTARELCRTGDFHGARELVAEGFRLGGDEPALTGIAEEIARAESAAEQQRAKGVRDRMAAKKVEAARKMSVHDVRSAIAFLEKDDSGHPAIAAMLQESRAEAARQDHEARQRAELERAQQAQVELRAREEAERRAREQQAREKQEREKQEREKQARNKQERERQELERQERARQEHERQEREYQAREQEAREKQEREKQARERREREKQEREKQERDEQERDKQEREKQERLAAEAEAEAERRRKEEHQRERELATLDTVVHERSQQTRQDVETVLPLADPTMVVRPSPSPQPALVPPPRTLNVPLLSGVAAMIVAAVIGTMLMRGRLSDAPQTPVGASPPPPIAALTTTVPPAPAPPAPANTIEIDRIVRNARTSLTQGNVAVAARTINDGVTRAPENASVQTLVQEILRTASAQAQQAKITADRANTSSRPPYQEAMTHLRSAEALRVARRVEPAVNEYATAARLFGEATRAPQSAQLSTVATTIPAADPPVNPTRVTPAPAPAPSTVATTSSVVTTSILPSIDQNTVQRVLLGYASASRTFNVAAIEQIYPELPANSRLRLDALRKNFSYCDYKYSNVRIVSATPTEATIRADSLESCKPKTAQRAIDTSVTQQLHLRKGASGTWTITEILGLQ